jgi:hypothetical protein
MNKKAILTMAAVTILLFSGFIHGAIPASERAALIALYNSTNGDGWKNKSGWRRSHLCISMGLPNWGLKEIGMGLIFQETMCTLLTCPVII